MPYFFRRLFLLGFVTLSACALVDGIMGPAMFTSEEICDQVQRIWQDCNDSYDATSCNKFVTCTQENKNNCDERWDEWVRCLRDSEPSCNEAGEDTLPCREKAEYFLTCVGDNNLEEGYYIIDDCISRNDLPSPDPVCGDGICQIEADENPTSALPIVSMAAVMEGKVTARPFALAAQSALVTRTEFVIFCQKTTTAAQIVNALKTAVANLARAFLAAPMIAIATSMASVMATRQT